MHSVKRSRKLTTATASLLWRKSLEFRGGKTFHNLTCLRVITVLLTVLALILLYGGHFFSVQRSHAVSHIVSGFVHHIIMRPKHTTMFPDSIIAA